MLSLGVVLVALAGVVHVHAADERVEICVKNERSELIKAYWNWEQRNFDNVLARSRICYQVVKGVTYVFTTWSNFYLKSITVTQNVELSLTDADVAISPASKSVPPFPVEPPPPKLPPCGEGNACNGHGECYDRDVPWASCRCYNDTSRGFWDPPYCMGCSFGFRGIGCVQTCNYNGIREGDEECDDGNDIDGDGCSSCSIDEVVVQARAGGGASVGGGIGGRAMEWSRPSGMGQGVVFVAIAGAVAIIGVWWIRGQGRRRRSGR